MTKSVKEPTSKVKSTVKKTTKPTTVKTKVEVSAERQAFNNLLKKNAKLENVAHHSGRENLFEVYLAGFKKGKASK